MIKKLILALIAVVSLYGSWTAFKYGYVGFENESFSMILYEVPSYEDVQKSKDDFDSSVEKLDNLNKVGIPNASGEVDTELRNYAEKKGAYEQLKSTANVEQIAEANKIEIYLLDYLWIRVGNFANDNAVKFKMTPNSSNSTLDFNITGSYISVINFIYDLQNDEELDFEINGIQIRGSGSNEVKAQFTVENINVVTSPNETLGDSSQGTNLLNSVSITEPEAMDNIVDNNDNNSSNVEEEIAE